MSTDSDSAVIFDIQRFSLHDGPGIRTTVFFKGCPLRCVWCQNPEGLSTRPEMAFYRDQCLGCFECAKVCRKNAILTTEDRRIDPAVCTACGECAAACPADAIRVVGRTWHTADLVAELLKDRDFYANTGGGVTLSGGEPMGQWRFLGNLLPRLTAEGIHVTLETSGHFPWHRITALLPKMDLVYCDLKHMDREQHRKITGIDNRTILENVERLAASETTFQPRMPLVPGLNDDCANIRATAALLRQCGLSRLHLLPYHHLWEAKLLRLNTRRRPLGIAEPEKDSLAKVIAAFESEGIDAVISA